MCILRWRILLLLTVLMKLSVAQIAQTTPDSSANKILRIAFPVAETGFDPPQVGDLYSLSVTAHIFEGLYEYDHWARPAKIRPSVADGMPQVSADFKTWTIRIKPGIFFANDKAFEKSRQLDAQGRRELTAADFVYSFKRYADPATKSHAWGGVEETGFLGLAELRANSLKSGKPFDYDQEIEGIRTLDRYTLQLRTAKPRPSLIETLASGDSFGAVTREVVEFYGDQIMAHPVGTGPYRLAQWRRSSLIVLERNPLYRDVRWDFAVDANDAESQAVAKRLRGQRLPLIDRIEISIIEEQQPRWLAFLNQQIDALGVPSDFVQQAMPQGKLAPNLARRKVQGYQSLLPVVSYTYFNMEDPIVGGYTPEKVALRRAVALGMDVEREIRLVRRGQAIPAQSAMVPHTTGYDPKFRSDMSRYDPARAKALLDIYGYIDRDKDGWRDRPDGSPLTLQIATQSDQNSRQFDELWKRNMTAIGLRVEFNIGKWPEQLKAARAGKLMMWTLGGSAGAPDGQGSLARFHSQQTDGQNLARFKHPRMDAIYERMSELPESPERDALFFEAKRIATAYMPYKFQVHTIATDLVQPWLIGWKRTLFWQDWWHRVDIDTQQKPISKP